MVCTVDMSKWFVCVITLWFGFILPLCKTRIYTNQWAVRLSGGPDFAHSIAGKYGYTNLGQIGGLKDHYLFSHPGTLKRAPLPSQGRHSLITMETKVEWIQQQVVKRRVKREYTSTIPIPSPAQPINLTDPRWNKMWYMRCSDGAPSCHTGMNIAGAWGRGYTGKGVVVTILDDGIERNHTDLMRNYDAKASYDINGNDRDPMPQYDSSNKNKHGTRCAGIVAASANSLCAVGVAFNAKIGGVRMLDGDVTDVVEAWSLSLQPQHIDVYSASWGPVDDGQTTDGPGPLAHLALESGVRLGRKGRGSIFVWASGNGGRSRDHCSCDGYASSIYTVSVSSSTRSGSRPAYLEKCASTLSTTYSSAESYDGKKVSPDVRKGCTDGHAGTSGSASIAAGIVALALEANPRLTWRDLQHIIVRTSRASHLSAHDWHTNAAGYHVSHLYGFGLMDAEAMVREAERWRQVPSHHTCVENIDQHARAIPPHGMVRVVYRATGCSRQSLHHVSYLEHVVVKLTITHPNRGHLSINLISPSGTKSQLLSNRPFDHSADGFKSWEFMTTHCWGEKAAGDWTLEIHDSPPQLSSQRVAGKLIEWSLVLYGTSLYPYSSLRYQHPRSAEDSDEDITDYSGPCDPECDEFGCEGPGAHQCIGCLHHFLKNKNNTRTCVLECPSGFYADSRGRCKKCYSLCETCVGGRSSQCTSCKAGYYSKEGSSSCVPSCGDGYYLDSGGSVCRKCSENCVKCTSADACSECTPGTSLQGNLCRVDCDSGSFYSRERSECEPCHRACATCAGASEGACTSCSEGFLLEEWMCVPSCSDGFYPATHLDTCNRCDSNCLTCVGPGGNCSSCVSGLSLQSGRCVHTSSCRDGEYQDKPGNCHLCDLACHQCKGPESWDCISCTPGRALEEGRCDIGCSPGKYVSDGQCRLCDHTCGECSGGGPENCTTCEKDKFGLERFLFHGQCVVVCPEDHFHSEDRTCDPCPANCKVCSAPDWCLRCNSTYHPRDGVCMRMECGEGEVEDPEYGECMMCEEGCRKCVLYNPRHCLSCTEGFYQFQDSCYKTCPAKTYNVEEEMTCVRCAETCVSCDEKECFWCEADFFLSDGQCVQQCEEGYYGDEESQECERCPSNCRTCSGPEEDDCDSCEGEEQLENGVCVKEQEPCPRNSFLSDEGECESCHSSCETCWGEEKKQCSTCVRGRFLTAQQMCVGKCPAGRFGSGASGRCELCPHACAQCVDQGQCLRCHSGHRNPLYLQNGLCVHECERGYPTGHMCQSCVPECVSCEGNATHCLSCVEPLVLHQHSCAEACPPAHFSREGRCHSCPPSCRDCTAENLCRECEESHFLSEAGAVQHIEECRRACPSNTYYDSHSGECRDCEDSCLTCSGPGASSCSSCSEGMTLDKQGRCAPVEDCPPPSYRDQQGQCQPCHIHCARCFGPSKLSCLSCNPNHFLLNGSCLDDCPHILDSSETRRVVIASRVTSPACPVEDKECVETCQPSYYGNTSTGACERCDPSCGECSGAGDARCLSCRDGHLYLRTHGHCRLSCPPGHYPDSRERTCESCHSSCRTCTDKGFLACDSCHIGYSLSGGMCESQCIMGQYPVFKNADLRCEQCDASCMACQGPGPNNCTVCPDLNILSTGRRCLPCCGNETQTETLLLECCNCTETRGHCVLSTNIAPHNMDDSTESAALFIITFVLLLLGLGAIFFLIRRGPRHQAGQLVDLSEKDDDDDEDIVYMSRDGTVYRKFRYGQLEDQEE
ncbi:hypothetical protein AAFF_G00372660 [Aldrovandia affinis]|uniref:P/Homo B domain-containing protein n=1 Tax=Aldrovandia affinis TaxID=143900 RepID=A0AAD7SGB0_9TELE|nr:hypothetical protein AAFF_G00372660 [Aldrovandia affinis]